MRHDTPARQAASSAMIAAGSFSPRRAPARSKPLARRPRDGRVRVHFKTPWRRGILEAYPVTEVDGEPASLLVPDEALWPLDKDDYVFERVEMGEEASLRSIRVTRGSRDARSGTYVVSDLTRRRGLRW